MARSPAQRQRAPGGRVPFALFVITFAAFVIDVLLGKAVVTFGWQGVPLLSDVAEFLLLLLAVTLFVIATLRREQAETQDTETSLENKHNQDTGGPL